MSSESVGGLAGKARALLFTASALCGAVAASVLLGWLLDIPFLRTMLPGSVPMKVNAAAGAALAVAVLLASARAPLMGSRRAFALAGSACVFLLGAATLSQDVFAVDLGIDQLLVRDETAGTGRLPPGRMAPQAALNLALAGAALFCHAIARKRCWIVVQSSAILILLTSLLALVGYAYGVPAFVGIASYAELAAPAAVCSLILSLCLLSLTANSGYMRVFSSPTDGGIAVRRLLPVALILPLVIGWLRLEGERAGLYGSEFGLALFATSNAVILAALMWWHGWWLDKALTERTGAEAKLRESEQLLRTVLDTLPVGVWITDSAGKIQHGNPAGKQIWAGARYVGVQQYGEYKGWWSESGKRIEAEEWALARAVLKGETSIGEMIDIECFDGTRKTMLNSAVPMRDAAGKITGAIVVNQDITELRQSQRDLADAQRIARMGSWSWEVVSNELRWSQEVFRIFGIDPSLTPTYEVFMAGVHPDDRSVLTEAVQRALKEKMPYEINHRVIATDGSEKTAQCTGIPQVDEAGGVIRLFGTIQDISEQVKAEKVKEALEAQLQQAQKMEAIGRLAGGVAHDFNNLLTVIIAYSDLLLDRLQDGDPRQKELTEIRKAGDRASALTRQLLAFSRRQVLTPTILDINEVVMNMDRMLRRLIGEDIELMTRLTPDLGSVRADRGQIEQVIMNLAVNARDALMDGGGRILIETESILVTEERRSGRTHLSLGQWVMVAVTDNGCGMDKETVEHIFEPFFTTKGQGEGTGLGLSTVYGIVQQSAGVIDVQSAPERGSTFKVFFPCAREEADGQAPSRVPPASTVSVGTESVLVVEDEPGLRRLIAGILRSGGYRVSEAQNGAEAVALMESGSTHIDLVITDVIMPVMGGRDLAKRAQSLQPDVKIMFISGYSDRVLTKNEVLEPGLNYLPKPFTPEILRQRVRQVLEAKT